jgi:cytosine/adenosine deaminase-related metal-dependent hydrolase
LLRNGTGELADMMQQFNAWDDQAIPRGLRPLDYLIPLADLSHALVIHGNYLNNDEVEWLAQHPQVSVVYCPRTHAFFGHSPHPWLQLHEGGVNVALGTDSRGSNPDLSLWNEMRFLVQRFPHVDPAHILEMGTLAGARALGREFTAGSIDPGKQASLSTIRLPTSDGSDPHRLLFAAASSAILTSP